MPKFRVWDNKNRKFIKSPIVWFEDDEVRVFLDISDVVDWVEQTNVEVMQSTGLKDKNGVEIFEGDVMVGWGKPSVVVIDTHLGVGLRCGSGDWNGRISTWLDYRSMVIGNIYENPELLK